MSKGVFPFVLITVLIALALIAGCAQNPGVNTSGACSQDSDCVPNECCHPTSCILTKDKRPCNLLCTQNCQPDTMDCGQGSCKCLNSRCEAVYK
jgi:hypothetical protein